MRQAICILALLFTTSCTTEQKKEPVVAEKEEPVKIAPAKKAIKEEVEDKHDTTLSLLTNATLIKKGKFPVRILREDGSSFGFRYLDIKDDVFRISSGAKMVALPKVKRGDLDDPFDDAFIYRNTLFIVTAALMLDTINEENTDDDDVGRFGPAYYVINLNTMEMQKFSYLHDYGDIFKPFQNFMQFAFVHHSHTENVVTVVEVDCELAKVVQKKIVDITVLNGPSGKYEWDKRRTAALYIASQCRIEDPEFSVVVVREEQDNSSEKAGDVINSYLLYKGTIKPIPELKGRSLLYSDQGTKHTYGSKHDNGKTVPYDTMFVFTFNKGICSLQTLWKFQNFGKPDYWANNGVVTFLRSSNFLFISYNGRGWNMQALDSSYNVKYSRRYILTKSAAEEDPLVEQLSVFYDEKSRAIIYTPSVMLEGDKGFDWRTYSIKL